MWMEDGRGLEIEWMMSWAEISIGVHLDTNLR